VLVSGATAVATLSTTPLFAAESSLIVRIGREYIYRPESGPDTVRMPSLTEMVNSEVGILESRDLAESVVRQMGVARLYPDLIEQEPDPERAVARGVAAFRGATDVHPVPDSTVIKVGFEHEDPASAAEAVNLLVAHFVDKHVEVLGEEGAGRLEAELAQRSDALETAEQALAEFKRANGLVDLPQQQTLLLGRQVQLRHQLDECEQAIAAATPAGVEQEEPAPQPELPPGLSLDMRGEILRQRYELERERRTRAARAPDWLVEQATMRDLDLELEERKLLLTYAEDSRRVQGVRAERERVHAFLANSEHPEHSAQAGTGAMPYAADDAPPARDLEGEIARLDGQILLLNQVELQREHATQRELLRVRGLERADLEHRLAEAEGELASLDRNALALRRLERDVREAESACAAESARVDESRRSSELDRDRQINVRVIQRAAPPITPLGLSRTLQLALGVLLGLVFGAGTVVALDLFRAR
jgi:uncharacterized protein involved in exopolysaccharide biosynthesis